MREFKFRAYHPDWHELVYTHIPVNSYYEDMVFGKRAWCPFVFEIGTGRYPHGHNLSTVIMQWTGKYDIHGTEIYEKDLLKPLNGLYPDDEPYEVTWDEDNCQFRPGSEYQWEEVEWEIVGNTYFELWDSQ